MADSETLARRSMRTTALFQLAAGFTAGKIAVGMLHQFMPDRDETVKDEALLLAGAGFAGYKAIKGGKNSNLFAGAALAAVSPILDGIADKVQSMLKPSADAA